jgi:hypothetical protein
MSISGSYLLSALRRRRYGVLAALLPALVLSMTTGSSCLAMALGHGAAASHGDAGAAAMASMAHMEHMGHQAAAATTPAPNEPLCPHCQTADHLTAAAHSACGAADVAAAGNTFAKHASLDAQPLLAASWVPLPATPAPPLIRAAAPPYDAAATSVPLHIRHCVLLI